MYFCNIYSNRMFEIGLWLFNTEASGGLFFKKWTNRSNFKLFSLFYLISQLYIFSRICCFELMDGSQMYQVLAWCSCSEETGTEFSHTEAVWRSSFCAGSKERGNVFLFFLSQLSGGGTLTRLLCLRCQQTQNGSSWRGFMTVSSAKNQVQAVIGSKF